MKRLKLIIVILISFSVQSVATVCTSKSSGNWDSPGTWVGGNKPGCVDTIIIKAGHLVIINMQEDYSTSCSQSIYIGIHGKLSFKTGKKIMLPAGSVVEINIGGVLEPGNGGGSSNLIEIGGFVVWKASDGIINGYAIFQVIPLPIQLLGFEANQLGDKIEIKWTTASETNNDYFTIEKTKDGKQYEKVATIEGAGNSISMQKYSVADNYPYEGHSYYHLKQTDFNGSNSQFNLVAVDFIKNADFSLKIYPNPSDGVCINLDLFAKKGEETFLVVNDSFGNPLYSKAITINEKEENIFSFCSPERLKPGIYFIKVSSMQKEYVKKFLVE